MYYVYQETVDESGYSVAEIVHSSGSMLDARGYIEARLDEPDDDVFAIDFLIQEFSD